MKFSTIYKLSFKSRWNRFMNYFYIQFGLHQLHSLLKGSPSVKAGEVLGVAQTFKEISSPLKKMKMSMTKILFDICSWCIDKLVKIWKKSSIFIVGKSEIIDLRQIFGRVFFRKKNSLIFRRRQKQLRKSLNLQLIIVISIQK